MGKTFIIIYNCWQEYMMLHKKCTSYIFNPVPILPTYKSNGIKQTLWKITSHGIFTIKTCHDTSMQEKWINITETEYVIT